ncbi:Cysteinyl-tRNA synthetase/mycothiol ligase [Macleaya cordata]|uniref:Cysteinyl-tRNA synthetase/mycothiol ligase n=1 Tax=Macleaya cordata TaxID=56857 RepID=A0A200QHA5_MACCD|nr:Cysteinyl-tRNA synthetase/mycothiol ligase [Macleaya cordata]
MSNYYLTSSFDIHGGGMDLIFPHHENELAQSSAGCSECNIKYWMHNGFVTLVNAKSEDEKMSKSGSFFTIRETLHDCEEALSTFRENNSEGRAPDGKVIPITSEAQKCINKLKTLRDDFQTEMSDDLQTPNLLKECFIFVCCLCGLQRKQQQKSLFQPLTDLEKEVKVVLNVLGLMSSSTYSEVLEQLKDKASKKAGLTEEYVTQRINKRTVAREKEDVSKSDKIRQKLTAKGIALMDLGNQTIWRPCARPIEKENPLKKSICLFGFFISSTVLVSSIYLAAKGQILGQTY